MPILWTASPVQRFRAATLLRDGMHCALEGKGVGPCWGKLEAHHIIPRQYMVRELRSAGAEHWVKENAISDSRNGVMLCHKHHGQPGDLSWQYVPEQDGLLEFSEQYGFQARVMHQFGEVRQYQVHATDLAAGKVGFTIEWSKDTKA